MPHDLADAVWFNDQLTPLERVDLHFSLYRMMPCYASLMYSDLGRLDDEALVLTPGGPPGFASGIEG